MKKFPTMGHEKGEALGQYPLQGSLVTAWGGAAPSFIHSANMGHWEYHSEQGGHGPCPQGAST